MDVHRVARVLQDREQVVREVVFDATVEKKGVVHGSRAFNLQVPRSLRKKTKDFDILVDKPKKVAKSIAETLRRRVEGNVTVGKGGHKGTYRIRIDDEPMVDVTQKKGKVRSKSILGLDVKKLSTIKRSTQKLVKKKGTEFRRAKDEDTLSRIREIERIHDMF